METKKKVRTTKRVEQAPAWETRHENDADGPLANNSSDLPDRTSEIAEGSPGEAPAVHGSGFQEPAGEVHPNFPAVTADIAEHTDDEVRRRAYQLWEEEGFPEGGQERHWLQAEQELRGRK
ncbi:MAG: DUF2934 domain-containing protein [Aquamicrobium sp.]|nr:DUF2934 domain-containing protein [Aquamicrobium sp.]